MAKRLVSKAVAMVWRESGRKKGMVFFDLKK